MVDGLGPDVEVAAQERRQRLARATVAGHHVKIDAEGLGGQERAQPPAHADALDPPGDALDLLQIRDGLVGALGRYVQAEGVRADAGEPRELAGLEADGRFRQHLIPEHPGSLEVGDGVAVGLGAVHEHRSASAGGAGDVLDDDIHALGQVLLHAPGGGTGDGIVTAAGRERYDQVDVAVGKGGGGLRQRQARCQAKRGGAQQYSARQIAHVVPPVIWLKCV